VAENILDRVQTERELTPTSLESWDGDLRVVDDLVTIGVGDGGGCKVEWEGTLPCVGVLVILVLVLFVVITLLGVLVLVSPFRSGRGHFLVLVVLWGRGSEDEGWEGSG